MYLIEFEHLINKQRERYLFHKFPSHEQVYSLIREDSANYIDFVNHLKEVMETITPRLPMVGPLWIRYNQECVIHLSFLKPRD